MYFRFVLLLDPSADIFEVHANPGSCFFMSVSENALHCCLCVGNDVLIFNIKVSTDFQ